MRLRPISNQRWFPTPKCKTSRKLNVFNTLLPLQDYAQCIVWKGSQASRYQRGQANLHREAHCCARFVTSSLPVDFRWDLPCSDGCNFKRIWFGFRFWTLRWFEACWIQNLRPFRNFKIGEVAESRVIWIEPTTRHSSNPQVWQQSWCFWVVRALHYSNHWLF